MKGLDLYPVTLPFVFFLSPSLHLVPNDSQKKCQGQKPIKTCIGSSVKTHVQTGQRETEGALEKERRTDRQKVRGGGGEGGKEGESATQDAARERVFPEDQE